MYQCDLENKKLINRINRIQGQVNSVKKKLENKTEENIDPYELVRELSAIKGAVNGMITSYIEHYAKGHLVSSIRESKDELSATILMDELINILKSYSK